jgi:hypothetical protein
MEANTVNHESISRFCILIKFSHLLTKSEYEAVYNVLFTRRNPSEQPSIRKCLNSLAIGTKTKKTFNEDDDQDEILITWRYDKWLTPIPRFETDWIGVYEEGEDRKFKLLQKDNQFHLIGTNHVRLLSPPELFYLRKQLLDFIDRKKPLGVLQILK